MRILLSIALVAALGAGVFWWLSAPRLLSASDLPPHRPNIENGRRIFLAGGCAACHAAPERGADPTVLSGGKSLNTPFGAIAVPNISPDRTHGIGGWSPTEFANAMTRGVSPSGHYYVPAFPWTSYRAMALEDVADLKVYLDSLPGSERANDPGGLPFPYGWRRPIGIWKAFFLPPLPEAPRNAPADIATGHYLTVAVGHCGECHTPRTFASAMDPTRWLAGAPAIDGSGTVPNITPSREGIGDWSLSDIAYMLESGFTPEFDSVGGDMGPVIDNWAALSDEDRRAVAAYLKAITPLP